MENKRSSNIEDGPPTKKRKSVESTDNRQFQEFYNILVNIFPDGDPEYFQNTTVPNCLNCPSPAREIDEKINEFLERKNYPTREESIKRKKNEELQERFTKNFNLDSFLKLFPNKNPKQFYNNSKSNICETYKDHSAHYLETYFPHATPDKILTTLKENNFSLYQSFNKLQFEIFNADNSSCKESHFQKPEKINMQYLQEVAYIEHEIDIEEYRQSLELVRKFELEEAKLSHSLVQCGCCFDDECLISEVVTCTEGHIFCSSCVEKYAQVRLGEAEVNFPCMELDCEGGEFSLKTLQSVISSSEFSLLIRHKQIEEIKGAGIQIDNCPFCEFSNIVEETDKVFVCPNNECRKESCRLCKKENHLPFTCNHENSMEEARKSLEEKLSNALIRACPKCGQKYVKQGGCNHITCGKCKTHMCYICRKVLQAKSPYNHFRNDGCPLHSDDSLLHVDAIVNVAKVAEAELAEQNPDIKIDLTTLLPNRPKAKPKTKKNTNRNPDQERRILDATLAAVNKPTNINLGKRKKS